MLSPFFESIFKTFWIYTPDRILSKIKLIKFQTQSQYFGDLDVYHFHPVAGEKITLTEKIFIKFLLKEIELIGLQIEGKRSGLEGDVLDGDTNINQKGEHINGGTICV